MVLSSLQGLPAFILYFCVATFAVAAYLFVYTRLTSYDEFALIRANVPGAAIALGLSLIGFSLPLGTAIAHASDLVDCAIWAAIALVVQIFVYFVARIPVPDMSTRIEAGEIAPAIWLGLVSVTAGMLSSSAMSY
jgi:putative membrane protein